MKVTTAAGEINVPGVIKVGGTSGQRDDTGRSGQMAPVEEKSTTTTTTTTITTPTNR